MPTEVTAVEPSQANGRAEQRVRALRERLQILVEDARRRGAGIMLGRPVARCAVRHAEIQNFLVKSDVDLSGGGTIKITPREVHTRDKAPSNVVGFLERVLVRNKINDDKQSRFLVGWSLGHKDADISTHMEDGNVRYNGSWKYSPERRSTEKDHELQSALAKMKTTKPKVQGCVVCEQGINVSLGRKHTLECRQTILPSLVTDSLWTVKFDADGKSLKRHEHEGDDGWIRVQKRVRFTHKQPDKRADSEVKDDKDTHAKREKLCDTPSSSSSSHEFAPMLHDSSGVGESAETRESVMKRPRVDDDMEISAIETLTNAKLEVDRALDTANKTLHRLLDECPHESEAVTKAVELNSIKDKRVYAEMYESDADAKIISGKWVLKPHKARNVLRGFQEDVKDEDVFASTTMTASVSMVLSQATDLRSEGYTVFTADVNAAFLNAHMKDSDVVHARPPPEWQPETLDSSKGTVIWKLQKSLYGLRSAPRRWQDHLEEILRKCGFVANMLDTCLWTHPTKRVSLVFHVDDLMLAGTQKNISEVLAELRRDLEIKRDEVTTKPTRYLGRTLVKTEEG